jgi:hypothetical protein
MQPLPPLVPDGWALADLMENDRPAAIAAVKEACREWIADLWIQLETMLAAYGVRENPDPQAWLAAALLIPDEVWAEYKEHFPKRYAKRWDKFQKLRERSEAGEWAGAADEADRIVRDAQRPMRTGIDRGGFGTTPTGPEYPQRAF